jgi:hypothetical protein
MNKSLARLGIIALFLYASHPSQDITSSPQNDPAKRANYDYMNTILSRNTKPLGLKEDKALKRLLQQPSIKWAIRAGIRHILD